jgi:hypothetical protein
MCVIAASTASKAATGVLRSGAITHAEEWAVDADILVQTLPMQSATPSADDAVLTLRVIRLEKPREVCEGGQKAGGRQPEAPTDYQRRTIALLHRLQEPKRSYVLY